MVSIFVAGEGATEIGKWSESPERWNTSERGDGVLAALFRRAGNDGEVIAGGSWSSMRKFATRDTQSAALRGKDGKPLSHEQRTLVKLAYFANARKAQLLLWSRDTDGVEARRKELQTFQVDLRAEYGDKLRICGDVAEPAIESWLVALAKKHKSPDELNRQKLKEIVDEHGLISDRQKSEFVEALNDLDSSTSPSLKSWLAQLSHAK